jgi:DNA-binding response OmpR family regulator
VRILLAEDDAQLGDAIASHLKRTGHAVDWLRDGATADTALRAQRFDLVILDLGLPRMAGRTVLEKLRDRREPTPVLIITAQDALADRVSHLDAGADDYLIKPFALAELDARLRALLRRSQGSDTNVASYGRLRFDRASRSASVDGQRLDLSVREIAVLETLLAGAGRVAAKERILDHLCTFDADISANAVEVYVHRLRKKLEPIGIRIATVRGLGYYLDLHAE